MGTLFELMRGNMAEVAPSGLACGWEKAKWLAEVIPALKKAPRQIALLYCEGVLAGFCMYYVNGGIFMVEELQIGPGYRSTSLAVELFRFFSRSLPRDTVYMEAFADKENLFSRKLMEKLGMLPVGETPDGSCMHYRGKVKSIFQ